MYHSGVPLMAYVFRRNSVYYLNIRLPKHLFRDRHSLRLSLNIRNRQAAIFAASQIAQRVQDHLVAHPLTSAAELRQLCLEWISSSTPLALPSPSGRAIAASPRVPPSAALAGPTLAQLSKQYLEEGKRSGTWRLGSYTEVERALGDLFELLDDMPAAAFSDEHARLLKERMSRCPQYFGLKPEFAGRSLREVIESGASYKTIMPVTVNNRLRKLSAFMNWAVTNKYLKTNPLEGMRVMTGSAKEARVSFETSDLKTLLNLETLKAESKKLPWRFWLPILGRTTGARIEELSQLKVDDVRKEDGIWCIRITDEAEDQNVKTSASRRLIPIHSRVLELGFVDYVNGLGAPKQGYIFPELEPVRGKRGHAPSKWFSRYKAKVGIKDGKKTFHSFRHTIIDDLRDAGTPDSLIKRIVGHEDSAVTFGVYGSRIPLKAMRNAIEGLDVQWGSH